MTASTVKSENVTNLEASPIVVVDKKVGEIRTVIDQISVATTSIDEVGDVLLFCPIKSNAVLLDVNILNTDLDTNGAPTLAVDIGLFYSGVGGTQAINGNTSGTVIDANALASATAELQSSNATFTSVRFENASVSTVDNEAWALAGLAADPGGYLYIGMTVSAVSATPATGTIVCRVDHI